MGRSTDRSSPWPVFVALGIATAELGVLLGAVPVAVGGVLVFGGSVAGMVREAGYAERPWEPLSFVGAVVGGGGLLVWLARSGAASPAALRTTAATDGIAARAAVVLGAGALLVVAGLAGTAAARWR